MQYNVANAQQFLSFTKNTGQLDQLNNFAEMMAAANPDRSMQEAGLAISRAMSGQTRSLQDRMNQSASVQLNSMTSKPKTVTTLQQARQLLEGTVIYYKLSPQYSVNPEEVPTTLNPLLQYQWF
ncbi:hypothetical protein SAMN05446037_1002261 [Anaerovirgula multivorans]|uniref:Uncharacterized protein n=1 Tax=Anaerovirgula multivorans TaxID=312168 RepID=A0A239AUQ9_9FIRM|nr:hypothetical protein [Anaerovirgula multivorans]SNR99052.1 hypothetical protein SAMN05446037_1002261 [Anaerovirgula multivorans]